MSDDILFYFFFIFIKKTHFKNYKDIIFLYIIIENVVKEALKRVFFFKL